MLKCLRNGGSALVAGLSSFARSNIGEVVLGFLAIFGVGCIFAWAIYVWQP